MPIGFGWPASVVVRAALGPAIGIGSEATRLRNERIRTIREQGVDPARDPRFRRRTQRAMVEDVLRLAGVPDVLGLGAPQIAAEIVPLDPAEPVDVERIVKLGGQLTGVPREAFPADAVEHLLTARV